MNLIFMRHGEATNNLHEIISDKEIYFSTLTENGINEIKKSLKSLPEKIDKIYVSPLPRTLQTASIVREKYIKTEVEIEEKIREINYGKFSGQKNCSDLDEVRKLQVAGDYFTRFGEYGENKFDVESRLCEFIERVYRENLRENTVLIISHGSVISFMKRILGLNTPHIKTGKVENFTNVDFMKMKNFVENLRRVNRRKVKGRVEKIIDIKNDKLKKYFAEIAKNEFNNIEYNDEIFGKIISGFTTSKLVRKNQDIEFDNHLILICVFNDFANFAEKFMEHYIKIGVKNFVMIDNNSCDESRKILGKFTKKAKIDFWQICEKFDTYKMCGWRQYIMEFYGENRWYLNVDSDELFVYKNYKQETIEVFTQNMKVNFMKSMMIDVYTKNPILSKNELKEFCFVDKNTYKISRNLYYGKRYYGGPRERVFGIRPSLQKIPLIFYTGNEVKVNDHFYYPWRINALAKLDSYLLHYKFLPGDFEKYGKFAADERHWNCSREYKRYVDIINKNIKTTFYDKNISEEIDDFLENNFTKIKR